MRRPSVDPAFTFAISLVLSLVLCAPTFMNMLHGTVDVTTGGIRYLVALGDLVVRRARRLDAGIGLHEPAAPAEPAPAARGLAQQQRRREDADDGRNRPTPPE